MTDTNLDSFRRLSIVRYYLQLQKLQPAEQAILDRFESQLSTMTWLDLGVGAGRTSQYIAHRVKHYIGVDYSEAMIEACHQRFPTRSQSIQFEVCDVRDLRQFSAQSFDFIFFSFNGIDNISHPERLEFLREVTRIGKPGGYFCFSTHNLQGIENDFSLNSKFSFNPLKTYVSLIMWAILRSFNRHLNCQSLSQLSHTVIRDESHNFRLKQYYIRPRAQLEQLTPFFADTTVYSWQTGEAIADHDLESQKEMWLYYLCKFPTIPQSKRDNALSE